MAARETSPDSDGHLRIHAEYTFKIVTFIFVGEIYIFDEKEQYRQIVIQN